MRTFKALFITILFDIEGGSLVVIIFTTNLDKHFRLEIIVNTMKFHDRR